MQYKNQHIELHKPRLILSGGGTGGHVFPAIAIANYFRQKHPEAEILFVGAKAKMEMQKVPKAGYPIEGLWIGGFQRKQLLRNINLPFKIISSLIKARGIIKKFRPDAVIGTGGYASFPLVYMASRKKIPCLLQEQNFFPGITNKYLAKYANTVCTIAEGLEKYFPEEKIVVTGNPVRDNIISKEPKENIYREFGLEQDKWTVLVTGGSLGARTINLAMQKKIKRLLENGVQVIWQTGSLYYDNILEKLKNQDIQNLWVGPFIEDMGKAYKIADMVVARAGAITISELAVAGKACILVPSPNVAEDHQTKNAQSLVAKGAARMVHDQNAEESLVDEILGIISKNNELTKLADNIKKFAQADAGHKIVLEIEKMIVKK